MRQQLQVPAARVKSVLPLAVHLGGNVGHWGKVTISQHVLFRQLCGTGPQCDRQGKTFTKSFNLTLAVVFLTSELYWLSHVERLEILEKVVLPPETPPKTLPLTV